MPRPSIGSSPAVTVYTVPNCPDCHALKTWFAERDIAYAERNLSRANVESRGRCPRRKTLAGGVPAW